MTPLPAEHAGRSVSGDSLSQRRHLTPFLKKTYEMVDDSSLNHLISWNGDGTSFIVWRPDKFAKDLLPKYFNHNNFSTFHRQLNSYGFRKVVPNRWEFSSNCFKRGEKDLLRDIKRREKQSPAVPVAPTVNGQTTTVLPPAAIVLSMNSSHEQVVFSNSSPIATSTRGMSCPLMPELVENERLRDENAQLKNDLERLRSENSLLKLEPERLRLEKALLHQKVKRLQQEKVKLHEELQVRLENTQLRQELEKVRLQYAQLHQELKRLCGLHNNVNLAT